MNKVNILFWNIGKSDLSNLIEEYCSTYSVDILVLIEDKLETSKMLKVLNSKNNNYSFCCKNDRGISIFTSFNYTMFNVLETTSQFLSLVELKFQTKTILFGAVHLSSKLSASNKAQLDISTEISKIVKKAEEKLGNINTLLVGDFNMNPFEDGMVRYNGFNSVMCREIASKQFRKVSGFGTGTSIEIPYFYNPMWSFLGDLSKNKPGTYYLYGDNIDNNYRWNTLDQILIRPNLIPNFEADTMKVIDKKLNGEFLIDSFSKSRRKSQICDHLPVFFSIDLTK